MESILNKSIQKEPKKPHNTFSFFINKNKEDDNLIHDFLCQPKIPLIGKYQHSEYSFGSILSLITLTTPLQHQQNITKEEKQSINLPIEIYDYLNVNTILTIDNNTKINNKNYFYPKNKVKFYFAISSSPTGTQSNSDQFNIVPHMLLNTVLDFSKQKRVTYNIPITLFVPKGISQSSGIIVSNAKNNDIDINNLRLEYSSIHLRDQGIAFSPNNLRFCLNTKMDLNHFYLLVTQQESDYHHLFYYILVNNKELENKIESVLKNSNTLEEVITEFQVLMKDNNSEIVFNLKQLFN